MICPTRTIIISALCFGSCGTNDVTEPVAAFSQTSDNGYLAPTSISFKNESTDARSYTWDFGDGSPISDNINPIHLYAEAGTFTITLIASNGDHFNQVTQDIDVFALPTADFSYSSDNDFTEPSRITFENKSSNSDTYSWNFGDGQTSSETNPIHTYSVEGTYTIQLTATNEKGSDAMSEDITIQPNKTQEQLQLTKLTGIWTLVSANDGQDRTSDFQNLKLTLEGKYVAGGTYNYSFTGTRPDPSPWPVSGTWKLGTNRLTDMIRDPGSASETVMNYQVTDTDLIITLNIPDGSDGWPGGSSRIKSVSGDWTFTFTN